MRRLIVALVVLWALPMQAQLRVTALDRAALPEDRAWGGVRFSPDGARLYLTPPDYRGIWEHTIATGALRVLTADQGSGFGFALSDDGRRIAWRRTSYDETSRARRQELVAMDLASGATEIVGSGRSVGTPAFAGNQLVARVDERDLSAPVSSTGATAVLGIEQMKIVVTSGGTRTLLEPLGEGRYVWPVLSPDKSRIAAYELVQGVFVCGLDGSRAVVLGPYRAPAWTRDGLWLVCMDDQDDGHQFVGSRLVAVRREGGGPVELSGTEIINAMYPACSPVEDLIACVSMTGELYFIRYAAEGR
jgi:hypothetical protein